MAVKYMYAELCGWFSFCDCGVEFCAFQSTAVLRGHVRFYRFPQRARLDRTLRASRHTACPWSLRCSRLITHRSNENSLAYARHVCLACASRLGRAGVDLGHLHELFGVCEAPTAPLRREPPRSSQSACWWRSTAIVWCGGPHRHEGGAGGWALWCIWYRLTRPHGVRIHDRLDVRAARELVGAMRSLCHRRH